MKKYLHKEVEASIAKQWEAEDVYRTPHLPIAPRLSSASRSGSTPSFPLTNKVYTLVMFPYPSGAGLHTGHARVYTGTDVIARYYRMNGKAVLHPMGWDAFGLPAENAAVKMQKNPMDMVPDNIANFKSQMQHLGLSYDWSREFSTTDPEYYKWTQWLFIQFFKMGLLHKQETPIFYCPSCKTGLAQEEVLANGTHERCGSLVEERTLPQWIFRITKYAEELLADLDPPSSETSDGHSGLDWPNGILQMQRNWIGKKEGMIIHHTVDGMDYVLDTFTAYPQWSFADTYIVIAPEHPLVAKLTTLGVTPKVVDYLKDILAIPAKERAESKEKSGVFTGLYAQDPFRPGEKMPIWIANFALMDFGTGAVRCSAHDPRDLEFAHKYNIPIKEVVAGKDGVPANAHDATGTLIDSGPFTGKEVTDVRDDFIEWTQKQGIGEKQTTYHLRDWIFSRQRYWGEPIPMVFCQKCADNKISYWEEKSEGEMREVRRREEERMSERIDHNNQQVAQKISGFVDEIKDTLYGWFPVADENLPLELPYVKSYLPTESGQSPLSQLPEFVNTTCPNCSSPAKRETDTMPNWAGSCWYFLYFARNLVTSEVTNLENWNSMIANSAKDWMPIDWYVGGAEHAVLHLLYARFWMKAMHDVGLVNFTEPFTRLRNVGMVLAEDHRKMSKSLGNVINPDDVVDEFGADTLRIYEMFMAPFNMEVAWSTAAMQGSYRFITRIWQMYYSTDKIAKNGNEGSPVLAAELQSVILSIDSDITNVKFNTAISTLMKFLNSWEGDSSHKLSEDNAKAFLQLLAPFAPFMTDYIWRDMFAEKQSIHLSAWPQADSSLLQEKPVTIAVQVNGKVRGTIIVQSSNSDEASALKEALKLEGVQRFVGDRQYKLVYIPGRVINFVVE